VSDSKGHIVVVDDEVDLANILTETFEMEQYKVSEYHCAEDALKDIDSLGEVQVIISDAHMPGMGGMDFLKSLKEKNLKPFHFFLCTGDMEITEEELIAAGGTKLISKPYNLFDLIDVVKDILES